MTQLYMLLIGTIRKFVNLHTQRQRSVVGIDGWPSNGILQDKATGEGRFL